MRLTFAALLIGLAVTGASAATEATRAVVNAIEAKDCAAAVKELNAAMATASPEAWLLGGAMFEQGLCLKANVERASRLYQRAAQAGRGDARSRLAALYALQLAWIDYQLKNKKLTFTQDMPPLLSIDGQSYMLSQVKSIIATSSN